MIRNATTSIRNCSETEVLALVYYLYQICRDIYEFEPHEECQTLYNALVEKLNIKDHADAVLSAMVNKLVKARLLVPRKDGERVSHPYDLREDLAVNFREDDSLFCNCGEWQTNTVRNINMVRALFAPKKSDFSRIVALTFFTKPGSIDGKSSVLPGRISVPERILKAVNDMSCVQFAKDSLGLSDDESRLLQAAYRLQNFREMYAVCNTFFRCEAMNRIDIYSKVTGKKQKDIRMLLKGDKKLNSYGLIDNDGDMDEDACDSISIRDMDIYFTDIVKPEKSMKPYSLDSFSVSKEQTDVAVQLLKSNQPCSILLYGAPGAGKTQYAKALVKEAGLKMFSYKNELEVSGKKDENDVEVKALSRLNCYLSLKKDDAVLVVDEAEKVLQTREFSFFGISLSSGQKGTVNKMLENSENKVIWIVNYTNEMDESTLRRFNYSIKFNQMPKETLRSIASGKLKGMKIPASLKEDILDLTDKYKVTGASVDNVVKAIKSLDYQKGNEEKVKADIRSVLEANSSLLYGKKKIRDGVKDSYDLSVLNTSIAAGEIVEMLKNAEEYRKENSDSPNTEGVRILFYGISGTGKTELARYISEKLGKPLLLKRCSDIIDPYVGRTEQKIAAAFEEAEATESILLFDEADSFFADRNGATHSWERTAVNEFLTQMEEFSGICICTTNLRKIMDPAMQRRFHIISEFKALNHGGIETLLRRFFGKYVFSEEQVEALVRYGTVTPGDFGSLCGKIRFVAKEKISSDYIVGELLKIQDEKEMNGSSPIGFAC